MVLSKNLERMEQQLEILVLKVEIFILTEILLQVKQVQNFQVLLGFQEMMVLIAMVLLIQVMQQIDSETSTFQELSMQPTMVARNLPLLLMQQAMLNVIPSQQQVQHKLMVNLVQVKVFLLLAVVRFAMLKLVQQTQYLLLKIIALLIPMVLTLIS